MKFLSWRKIVPGAVLLVFGGAGAYWWSLNPSTLLGNGIEAAWKGDYDRAIRELTLAIWRDPNPEFAYMNRAYAYTSKGDLIRSNEDLAHLIKLHPDFGAAYLSRGENYRVMHDLPHAIEDETKAIELGTPMAHSYRGLIYFNQSEYDKAIADFSEEIAPSISIQRTGYLSNSSALIAQNPIEPFCYRGMAYYRKGDYEHALPDLRKAVEIDPQNLNAYELLGNALINKGDPNLAVAALRKAVSLGSKNENVINDLGRAYMAVGDLDSALESFTKAISLPPASALPYVNRATIYNDKGEYDQAIADCNEAIRLQPDLAAAYYNRALSYSGKRDYSKVIEDCSKAIQLRPDFAAAYNNRSNAYASLGDREHAESDLQRTLELDPNDGPAYINLGRLFYLRRDYRRAVVIYNQGIEQLTKANAGADQMASAYLNRGLASLALEDFDSTIQDMNQALQCKPDLIDALKCRGQATAEKGNLAQAEADFTEALKLSPNDEGAQRDLARIQAMIRAAAQ